MARRERINIEPAPVGYNAWLEQKHWYGWERLDTCGWGQTPEAAEESIRNAIAEIRKVRNHMETGVHKIIDL
jgi:hypothetical protein